MHTCATPVVGRGIRSGTVNNEKTVERNGPWASPEAVGPPIVADVVVATVQPGATVIKGELGQVAVDKMLDSGLSLLLVQRDVVARL